MNFTYFYGSCLIINLFNIVESIAPTTVVQKQIDPEVLNAAVNKALTERKDILSTNNLNSRESKFYYNIYETYM